MNLSYRIGWKLFRGVFRCYFGWRIEGAGRVPARGAAILVANHASFLDPPLIGAALPRGINYLARESLFRFPGVGALLRSWNAVPVDRDGGGAKGLRIILDRLLADQAILLFPEGTRSTDGRAGRAHSGVGLIVVKSRAPVIPVRVSGTLEAYGRNAWFPRPRTVGVHFGQPLTFDELRREAGNCPKTRLKEIYQEVADQIMDTVFQLPPLAESRGSGVSPVP